MLLLVDEAIEVINTEIRILNMRIKYPIQFQNRKNNFPPSPLYLTDETYLVEIMELVSGMFLSKRVVTHNGTESPLTEIGRTFEYLFNIKLGRTPCGPQQLRQQPRRDHPLRRCGTHQQPAPDGGRQPRHRDCRCRGEKHRRQRCPHVRHRPLPILETG